MKKKIIMSIVAILLIATLIAGSFAWFYINDSTYADFGSDITCEAGESLEISDNGGANWSGAITKSDFHVETIDITGDGKNFYKPIEIDENGQPTGFVSAEPINGSVGEYAEIELMFRSATKLNVYLSEASFVSPVDPDKKGNILGDFSRDYIAGAIRVAFEHNGELKMVWAPNPSYELAPAEGGRYTFNEYGNREELYYHTVKNGTSYDTIPYTAEDFATSAFVFGSTGANSTTEGNSAKLFTLTPENGGFGIESIKVRIWFEGTDREAHEALAGGQIKVRLKFTGIEKSDNTAGQNDINNVSFNNGVFSGLKDGMSYSFDGLVWNKYYTANGMPDISSYNSVFFRFDETNQYFKTSVKTVGVS